RQSDSAMAAPVAWAATHGADTSPESIMEGPVATVSSGCFRTRICATSRGSRYLYLGRTDLALSDGAVPRSAEGSTWTVGSDHPYPMSSGSSSAPTAWRSIGQVIDHRPDGELVCPGTLGEVLERLRHRPRAEAKIIRR